MGLALATALTVLAPAPASRADEVETAAASARRAQADAARTLGVPVARTVTIADGTTMDFRLVPPGSFPRGRGRIEISRPYYIGVFEVTQAQWEAVMGNNPSYFSDREDSAERPVERVSWHDIVESFLPAIQPHAPDGMRFRLPTEAEWEHACRAGTVTAWSFGSRITPELANTGDSGLRQTVPVGRYPPNAGGLHDMHGNVSEWCKDWFDRDFYRQGLKDPVNLDPPPYGGFRVLRGGSWIHEGYNTRSTERLQHVPDYRNITTGFRVVLDFNTNREGSR